jgi:anaerobic selenocysteine-containing dehydrogenase
MNDNEFNRRDFLKVLGWGGTAVALSGCGNTSIQNGKETIVSYVTLPDYVIPGIANFFNTTCAQCSAGCNIKGRVREGRVLKAEGNENSPVNYGKMCGLGQAGVQNHYNPDRVTKPLLAGKEVTWEEALAAINTKLGGVKGEQVAFLTGDISGHPRVLLDNYMEALGSKNHFPYEAASPAVMRAVNKKAYGVEMPRYRIDKAKVIVSFGADFLGAWITPVHFAQMYARFRKGSRPEGRGTLVQFEPKMTLTGANADRWVAVRPGTEGAIALGLINALGQYGVRIPSDIAAAVKEYTPERVSQMSSVSFEQINKVAKLLAERSPSLILFGDAAEGYAHGSENALAIAMLNQVLGNVGKTVETSASVPFPQLEPTVGNRASLVAFNKGLAAGKYKVVFTYGANPMYSAPSALNFQSNFKKADFKVAFAHYMDETAQAADLVLPLQSAMEDWATVVPEYTSAPLDSHSDSYVHMSFRQPMMEPLYPESRGIGDILLALLKQRKPAAYKDFDNFYAYLHGAILKNKVALGGKASDDDDVFWNATLSKGIVPMNGRANKVSARLTAADLKVPPVTGPDTAYPLRLIPKVSASIRDGRNANEPWLQESPDPLTTVVWDSWVEINPKTAARLGIAEGDIIEITSRSGSIKTQAYLFPGIHPEVISVPVGYGHQGMGRYANGVGANVYSMLDPVFDEKTGELALNETNVKIARTGERIVVVKDEGAGGGTQDGMRIAVQWPVGRVDYSKEV